MKCELVVTITEVSQKIPTEEIANVDGFVGLIAYPSTFEVKFPIKAQTFILPVSPDLAKAIYESKASPRLKIAIETIDEHFHGKTVDRRKE